MSSIFTRIANPIVSSILKTPLHRLLSRSVLLISVTGKRSGRQYTFPVQYVQRDEALYVVSPAIHSWALNLADPGGSTVLVWLRGRRLTGRAAVVHAGTIEEAKAAIAGTSLASAFNAAPGARIIRISNLDGTQA